MASTLWSPQSSLGSSSYFLSPLSPYDSHRHSSAYQNQQQNFPRGLPAPLLSSSPVNSSHRRRTHSLMDNSLDLVVDGESSASNMVDVDGGDSGYFNQSNGHQSNYSANQRYAAYFQHQQMLNNRNILPQFMLSPVETLKPVTAAPSSHPPTNFASLSHFLHCRTELLVSGQQATPWNHFTIVAQLRKLENLNLIDRSLIKQENPPFEILTLVQKLVKYNLAMDIIDSEDEQLRQDQLTKLIKLRCEEVLAISGSITEITERRQAIYNERSRIRVAMKEIGVEIASKTQKDDLSAETKPSAAIITRPTLPPLLQNTGIGNIKPLICL